MSAKKRKSAAAKALEGPANDAAPQETTMSQYFFTFELIKQYPTTRSFIVKQPLKRSFKDTVGELFGGNKKGVYRF